MAVLRRAVLAVTRRLGRTTILLIIMLVISELVLTGFAIRRATEQAGVAVRRQLSGTLTLSYDMQKAMQQARSSGGGFRNLQPEPVTEEMAAKIAANPHVAAVNYLANGYALADSFEPLTIGEGQQNTDRSNVNRRQMFLMGGGAAVGAAISPPDVSITGVADTTLVNLFKDEQATLLNGRHISAQDAGTKVALIEQSLAEENKLKVGNTIRVKATNSGTTLQFKILGIYELKGQAASAGMTGQPFAQPQNRIYTDYASMLPLRLGSSTNQGRVMDSAVFFIDDPVNLESVRAFAKELPINWDIYMLDANDRAYRQMMGPVNQVASFASITLWVVALAGILVLALVLTLSIRERQYETGVLLSLGETKWRIVAQYLSETLLIALVAFCLSVGVGQWSAQAVGNRLLSYQLQQRETQAVGNRAEATNDGTFRNRMVRQMGAIFGIGNAAQVTPVSKLNIEVTIHEAGQMAITGLLVTILATAVPAASVMRYNPKRILSRVV